MQGQLDLDHFAATFAAVGFAAQVAQAAGIAVLEVGFEGPGLAVTARSLQDGRRLAADRGCFRQGFQPADAGLERARFAHQVVILDLLFLVQVAVFTLGLFNQSPGPGPAQSPGGRVIHARSSNNPP